MIVYIPTPITSAGQAEAFPVGTVAVDHSDATRMAYIRGDHGAPWYATTDGDAWTEHHEMVGALALVPVEAKEETTRAEPFADGTIHVSPQYWRDDPSRRLVTEWLPGPSPDRRGDCA